VWHSVWKYFGCTLHLLFHLDISVPWILITGQPWSLTWSQTMICQFQTTMHEQIRHIVVERMCTLICINFPSIWSFEWKGFKLSVDLEFCIKKVFSSIWSFVWKRRCFHRFGVLCRFGVLYKEGVLIDLDLEFCMETKVFSSIWSFVWKIREGLIFIERGCALIKFSLIWSFVASY